MSERSERQVRQELTEFTRPVLDPLDDLCESCGARPGEECAPECPSWQRAQSRQAEALYTDGQA